MRWEWSDGFIELSNDEISGSTQVLDLVAVAITTGLIVFSPRLYMRQVIANLDSEADAIATVEWAIHLLGIELLVAPPFPDSVPVDIVDGVPSTAVLNGPS